MSKLSRLDHLAVFLCTVTLLPCLVGCGDSASDGVLWVGRLGSDTVVVEGARQAGSRIDGTIVNVAAGLLVQRYEVDLDENGDVRALRSWTVPDLVTPLSPEAPPTLSVEMGRDSIRIIRSRPDGPEVSAIPAVEGAVPIFDAFFNNPMALMDVALQAAKARGDGKLKLYYLGSPGVEELPIREADSGRLSFPYVLASTYPMMAGARLRATLRDGGLTQFDARETTFKIVTDRDPWSDPLPLARRFEERGLGSGGISGMSPPRTASGHVGPVDIAVSYGQPSRRGRHIFPDVVPFGQVWRAGANAATEISFSADVLVEGQPVPAGSYSIWVVPGRQADTLILNKATRIWGVMYDAEQDLVRVPLRRELVQEPIESLTYSITPEAGAGRVALAWDDRRLSVLVEPADQAPNKVPTDSIDAGSTR